MPFPAHLRNLFILSFLSQTLQLLHKHVHSPSYALHRSHPVATFNTYTHRHTHTCLHTPRTQVQEAPTVLGYVLAPGLSPNHVEEACMTTQLLPEHWPESGLGAEDLQPPSFVHILASAMTLPRKAFLTVKHKTGLNHSWLFTQESSQISQDYEIFEVRHPKPSPSQPLAQWTLITYFLFKLPSQTIKPLRPGTTILCAFSYLFLVHPTPSSA